MSENETINGMYAGFTTIANKMISLWKVYSTQDIIRKILRCFPSMWRHMVTVNTQVKDLNTLTLKELIGSLRAHEVILQGDKPMEKEKSLALEASQKAISATEDDVQEQKKYKKFMKKKLRMNLH